MKRVSLEVCAGAGGLETLTRKRVSIEVCAGAGGLALGLEDAGFETSWAGEMDKHACKTLRLAVPNAVVHEGMLDGNEVTGLEGTEVDLLAGGPPCQGFSQAGKGLGEFDPRDGFPMFLRFMARLRPRVALVENVKGLTNAKHADYLEFVAERMTALGYIVPYGTRTKGWGPGQVLDAADFGVPQRRHRLILVAFREAEDAARWAWPEPTHSLESLAWSKWIGGTYWREHGIDPQGEPTRDEQRVLDRIRKDDPEALAALRLARWRTVRDAIGNIAHLTTDRLPAERVEVVRVVKASGSGNVTDPLDTPSRTVDAKQGVGDARLSEIVVDVSTLANHEPSTPTFNLRENGKFSGDAPRARLDEPSPTGDDGGGGHHPPQNAPFVCHDTTPADVEVTRQVVDTANARLRGVPYGLLEIPPEPPATLRRLTVRECARLQDFPDSLVFQGAKTAQYRQVGNAVPRGLARAVGLAIRRALGD